MKGRYFFATAVVCGVIAIIGLRANAAKLADLKNQIAQQDQAGQSVGAEIEELRDFVFSHMNSSARLELTASYQRALEAAQLSGVTGEIYAQAQAQCDQQGVSSVAQAQCVQNFLSQHLTNPPPASNLPLKSQFTYAYVSPVWTPDLAGLGLLGGIVFTIVALAVYILNLFRLRQT